MEAEAGALPPGGWGGGGSDLTSLLTASIGLGKFPRIMSSNSHKRAGGKEVSLINMKKPRLRASVICCFHS